MNVDEFDVEALMEKGLDFDVENQHSDDFVIHYRYGGFLWKHDRIESNGLFAWHKSASQGVKVRFAEISNTTMDELMKMEDRGWTLSTKSLPIVALMLSSFGFEN